MRLLLYIILLLLTFNLATGQRLTIVERKEVFEDAVYFYDLEEYKEALYNYQQLIKEDPDNGNINFQAGMCLLNIPGEEYKAIPLLEKAIKKISYEYTKNTFDEIGAPLHAMYYLGNAYRIDNQIDKALETYNNFLKSPNFEGNYNYGVVEKEIEACKRAKIIQDNPIQIHKENLGEVINTPTSNYNPVISHDEKILIYMTSQKFYDAILMTKKVNDSWEEPINITPQVGSDGDCYPVSLSADGKELYLVKKTRNNSDIYISYFKDNAWTLMQPLNKNINSKRREIHASISYDGKQLYFVSNRLGSNGFDIYISERTEGGDWEKPKKMDIIINTSLNEDTPYISKNGKVLFFSSEGHQNMGGFDIFYSVLINNQWSKPRNLGFPINTTGDDKYYMPLNNGLTGYHYDIDNKLGFGQEDIYKIEILSGDAYKDLINK